MFIPTRLRRNLIEIAFQRDVTGERFLMGCIGICWGVCILYQFVAYANNSTSFYRALIGSMFIITSLGSVISVLTKAEESIHESFYSLLLWTSSFGIEWEEQDNHLESVFLLLPLMFASWWLFIRTCLSTGFSFWTLRK
jgi:hypothetical protein